MVLSDILGTIELPQSQTAFRKPPKETFLVWFDNVSRRGGDFENLIDEHAVSLEVYSYKPDRDSEIMVEQALDTAAVEWEKTDRQFIQSEQLYMTIYDFSFTEKRA